MDKLNPVDYAIEMHSPHSSDPRIVIPLGFASLELARRKADQFDLDPHELPTEDKLVHVQSNINHYVEDHVQKPETALRPHQRSVFEDLTGFINDTICEEDRSGYVRLPTATGKTVVFVELCKGLLGEERGVEAPRILIVAPTKDLVNQTIGTNLEKGFSRFAPDISTTSYYSDTKHTTGNPKSKQIRDSQVCVTTYRSFGLMFSDRETSEVGFHYKTEEERRPDQWWTRNNFLFPHTGRNIIDMFDVIVFDEAHHVLGEATRYRVEQLKARGKICIGFTATADYSKTKNLSSVLTHEIHNMSPAEAIEDELLAPIVPLTVLSNKDIDEEDILNSTGQDYSDKKLGFLGHDEARNQIIVNTATELIENGVLPVISCVAGKDKYHPKRIAELLTKVEITDFFTGQKRKIRSAAIDSDMSTKERARRYKEFESGQLDALCFINILTEGWDSQRAKALINARPTRSKVFAQQRLGRVLRLTDEHAPVSFVIDILDNFEEYPPVLSADLIHGEEIKAGTLIGKTVGYEDEVVTNLIDGVMDGIGTKNTIMSISPALYSRYEAMVSANMAAGEYLRINKTGQHGETGVSDFATAAYMDSHEVVPYLTEELVHRLQAEAGHIDAKVITRGDTRQTLYDINDIKRAVMTLPEVDPNVVHIGEDGSRMLSAAGFKMLLRKHFPVASVEDMRRILEDLESRGVIDYTPTLARYDSSQSSWKKVYGCLKLYRETTYKDLARALRSTEV